MRKISFAFLACALLLSTPIAAEKPRASPLLGVWAVDVSALPLPPDARPKRVTVTFSQPSAGRLRTRVEVIDAKDAMLYAEGVTALDGTPAPVEGNLEADTAATTMPAPNVLVMQLSLANVPGSTRVYTVSPNGKSMTETAANFGADGRPFMRVNRFERIE